MQRRTHNYFQDNTLLLNHRLQHYNINVCVYLQPVTTPFWDCNFAEKANVQN